MSLYDDASLVMIPSGYKDGKLYSVKPSDGAGDFTFTRGSNLAATRVDENGLIEKGRENLLLHSNTFSNAVWAGASTTETSGQSGYDGTNNAWLLEKLVANGNISQSVSASNLLTYSVYAKAGTRDWLRLNIVGVANAYFDLANGVVGSTIGAAAITSAMVDAGGGWYRCSFTYNVASTTGVSIYVADADNDSSGTSGNIYIQDAQLEAGLVATDYIETGATTAQAGILEDMPRLDYSGGTCPALLLEPQRTNLCPNSEDVSNWFLTFATATPNDTISPEGVQNAAKIVTSNAVCNVKLTSIPVSPSTTYTASFYCKLTSGSGLQTRFYDNTNGANIEYYTYDSQIAVGEWKRVTRTFTTPAGCNNIQIWFLAASSSASVTAHYWGYQLEEGGYPTSYIPTYGTSVTRGADDCTNADVSSLLGSGTGTAFIDMVVNGADTQGNIPLTIGTGTANLVYLWIQKPSRTIRYEVYISGALQGGISTSAGFYTYGDRIKVALVWADDDFVMYINGTLIGTDTSGTAPTPTKLWLGQYTGGNYKGASISQVSLFPTRLSNTELATLTTL